MTTDERRFPEGHFKWKGVAIGFFLGVLCGIIIVGPAYMGLVGAAGMCVGLGVGSAMEARHRRSGMMRPLTEEESRRRRVGLTMGVGSAIVLLVVVLGTSMVM
jgi:hypothetical protein